MSMIAVPRNPVIEARGLSAGYGKLAVVRNLDLDVRAGEIVALLGANGAGKTTTLLTLAGAIRPLDGEIRQAGRRTTQTLARRARRGLGLVTEERSIFAQLTVAENLRLGGGTPEDVLRMFPELEAHMGRKAGILSGGQQQMLTLGRALARRPVVLLVDELSLGLAPQIARRLFDVLQHAARAGVGILLVEQHIRDALRVADRAYVLQRGHVVMQGSASELNRRSGEIEESYLAGASLE